MLIPTVPDQVEDKNLRCATISNVITENKNWWFNISCIYEKMHDARREVAADISFVARHFSIGHDSKNILTPIFSKQPRDTKLSDSIISRYDRNWIIINESKFNNEGIMYHCL